MEDTVYGAFAERVRETPDAVAVIDERGETTYGGLNAMACAIAKRLPQDAPFVGIVMDHGVEMIAAMLAALKIGAAYVPAEPDFPIERIAFMLDECAAVVVTQASHAAVAGDRPTVLVEPGSLAGAAAGDSPVAGADPDCALSGDLICAARPEDLAYVLYTSGTTGTPKGVSVENRNVCSYMRAFHDEFDNGPGDRMLQHSVCSFDIFVEEVFSTLLAGATLVIPTPAVRNGTSALARFIEQQGITIVDGFPFLMDAINDEPLIPDTVRLYVSGGDVLHAGQVSNLVDRAAVYNTYGPSETTCCAAYFRCDTAAPLPDGTYPIGHPILGTTIEVVDESLHPVPDGEIGEFLITGPGVSRGYLGEHPEQANFIVDADGIRHYRSGDMGYRDGDGNLVFLHRKDDQVMIGGKRVEAKEVENVLLQDAAVRQAVVVPRTDEAGFSYLTAYLVPADGDFSLGALKKRLARKLTPFMIPEFFVALGSIPLNDHGKPDKAKLPVVLKVGERP